MLLDDLSRKQDASAPPQEKRSVPPSREYSQRVRNLLKTQSIIKVLFCVHISFMLSILRTLCALFFPRAKINSFAFMRVRTILWKWGRTQNKSETRSFAQPWPEHWPPAT
jgi:hypothetical protein